MARLVSLVGRRLALLALLAAAGCGKFQKNRECTELAGAVNAFIGETQKAISSDYADPAEAARESKALAERYPDIGFVDATIVAMAERLKIETIATTDRRHFAMVKSKHTRAYQLAP